MEKKIMSLLFINIAMFILLTWISHFYNDSTQNKFFYQHYDLDRKFHKRSYRLLSNDKQDVASYINEEIPNNVEYPNIYIHNNESADKGKNKQLNDVSLNILEGYKLAKKDNFPVYRRINSRFPKKILGGDICYKNNLMKDIYIDVKSLRKRVNKKRGMLSSLFDKCPLVKMMVCLSLLMFIFVLINCIMLNSFIIFKVVGVIALSLLILEYALFKVFNKMKENENLINTHYEIDNKKHFTFNKEDFYNNYDFLFL
ncbi:Plasmodium exported protein, unknown function [Plasmodium malariae]|uniref:Uncharacterized protein n=1 Tax=Plasmodium malariae TaxID=5858 RepID=A0A1D3TDF1_PLAMA|nr:Plasmodium exported protein, unknown function [Plasmodium malariae]SCP02921.1 Plasmodium exported protein, unknown function [Plasmodium malariae]